MNEQLELAALPSFPVSRLPTAFAPDPRFRLPRTKWAASTVSGTSW
jgi:hypothetical protein